MSTYDNRFHESLPKEGAWLSEQQAEAEQAESPNSKPIISLGFLTKVLLATEEYWRRYLASLPSS